MQSVVFITAVSYAVAQNAKAYLFIYFIIAIHFQVTAYLFADLLTRRMTKLHPVWKWFACLQIAVGCYGIEMVSREEWGARPPNGTEAMATPVPHIFIHHTAMESCDSKESCSRRIRGIQMYHMDDRGWFDIGYNFLIGGDGRVYEGRGWDKVGAHTYGFNRNSVAFSLMGNFVKEPPPQNMLYAAKKMIEWARSQNYTTDDFKIHGHRDAGNTECPGQALYDIIQTWDRFQGGPLSR